MSKNSTPTGFPEETANKVSRLLIGRRGLAPASAKITQNIDGSFEYVIIPENIGNLTLTIGGASNERRLLKSLSDIPPYEIRKIEYVQKFRASDRKLKKIISDLA